MGLSHRKETKNAMNCAVIEIILVWMLSGPTLQCHMTEMLVIELGNS